MPADQDHHQWQPTFDDLGRDLSQITFVVVDLETTGASIRDGSGITEIGAVKVKAGEVLGTFQTFVNPGSPIPAFITVLTGITDAMVLSAPKIAEAYPIFLEFCGQKEETVLVAHNAPFDIGFLKGAAAQLGYNWPNFPVLDTARIARLILSREEVRDCKLATLSHFFRTTVTPNHRALSDAQATVDVLHGLLERLGSMDISTLEDLQGFTHRVTPEQRKKKHLADSIPSVPGVYIFKDKDGRALYVGTSKNLRTRVRNYFGSGETRRRIRDMVAITERIDVIECHTIIEAQIRELRVIADLEPRFNRRSRGQEKAIWLKLTQEVFPRLSAVRGTIGIADDQGWSGPFNGIGQAQLAMEAIHEVVPLRQCTRKLPSRPKLNASSCALYDMGKCGAPCIGAESTDHYSLHVQSAKDLLHSNSSIAEEHINKKMAVLSQAQRFEEAAEFRNRIIAFNKGSARAQRIRALVQLPHFISAIPATDAGQWEFVCIRYGRLAGSAVSKYGNFLSDTLDSLRLTSEQVIPGPDILPASSYEEVEKLLTYLDHPQLRLVEIDGDWSLPTFGSGALYHQLFQRNLAWENISSDELQQFQR